MLKPPPWGRACKQLAVFCVLPVCLWVAATTHAADAVDPTYGSSGLALVGPPDVADDEATPIAIVNGDQVVAVAGSGAVTRLTAAGTVDTTFGSNGVALMPRPLRGGTISDIAAAPPGGAMLLVGGTHGRLRGTLHLLLLTSAGIPDPSFGRRGIASARMDADGAGSRSLAVGVSGRVVVGIGSVLRAFRPSGKVATAFGERGKVHKRLRRFSAPVVAANGSVTVGYGTVSSKLGPSVARLTSRGRLDRSWGHRGEAAVCCTYNGDVGGVANLAVAETGQVYVQFGACQSVTGPSGGVYCSGRLGLLGPDGRQDGQFGSEAGGDNPININPTQVASGLSVDGSGRVLAAGPSGPLQVVRIVAPGMLDPSFGSGGLVEFHPLGCSFSSTELQVDQEDRPLVSGVACGQRVVVRLAGG